MKIFITLCCIVCATCLLQAQTLKQVEYFIDNDKGTGKNKKLNIAASADNSYQFTVDVAGVSNGFHKLYIRTKDNKGNWSLTSFRTIEITASVAQPIITGGEYFFDADPGVGNGNKIMVSPNDTAVMQNFTAVTDALDSGFHKLYTRFKNDGGKWSITNRRNILIIKTTGTVKVVAAEYFFDADKGVGNATAKAFASASADGTFKFNIPYNAIPAGADTLFARVEDSIGNWSLTKFALFTKQSFQKTASAANEKLEIATAANRFSIFPNPASRIIHIDYKTTAKTVFVQIFDMHGKAIMESALTDNNVDISKLASGTYLLQLTDGTSMYSAKFIKL